MEKEKCEHKFEYKNTFVIKIYGDGIVGDLQRRYSDDLKSIFVCKKCQKLKVIKD